MSNVFDKIIAGDIPCYKIYEDERVLAFLDINPETVGHTLVIPKVDVDKIYDLEDDDYTYLMLTAKKIAKNMEKVLGKRIVWKVIGVDVPHAHIHLLPFDDTWESGRHLEMSEEQMKEMQEKLAM